MSSGGGSERSYGATGADPEAAVGANSLKPAARRMRMNMLALLVSLLIPCFIFSVVSSMLAFKVRHTHPFLSHCVVAMCGCAVALFGYYSIRAFLEKQTRSDRYVPTWCIFLFVTSALALGLGWFLGQFIYHTFNESAYTLGQMKVYGMPESTDGADFVDALTGATHGADGGSKASEGEGIVHASFQDGSLCSGPGLDPKGSGVQAMDAGAVYFCPGSYVDVGRAMGFQTQPSYCVAPITLGTKGLDRYDFWAVGVGCCNDLRQAADASPIPNFHCGEVGSATAHAGMRRINDAENAYFELAVQQAEAAYGIKAEHPLFFTWVEDPINGEAGAHKGGSFSNHSALGLSGVQGFQMGDGSQYEASFGPLGLWPFSAADFGFGTGGGTHGGMNTQYNNGVRLHTMAVWLFAFVQALLVALAAYTFSKMQWH